MYGSHLSRSEAGKLAVRAELFEAPWDGVPLVEVTKRWRVSKTINLRSHSVVAHRILDGKTYLHELGWLRVARSHREGPVCMSGAFSNRLLVQNHLAPVSCPTARRSHLKAVTTSFQWLTSLVRVVVVRTDDLIHLPRLV